MLNIYPTANVNFQRQNSLRFQRTNADKPKKSHKEVKLALTLAGLAAIAAGAVWLKKNKAEPFEKALERSGVELKIMYRILREQIQNLQDLSSVILCH